MYFISSEWNSASSKIHPYQLFYAVQSWLGLMQATIDTRCIVCSSRSSMAFSITLV